MATANSSSFPLQLPVDASQAKPLSDAEQQAMLNLVGLIRSSIKNGAAGFLFATFGADGEMQSWFPGGNLDNYDRCTYLAAFELARGAQHFCVKGMSGVTTSGW